MRAAAARAVPRAARAAARAAAATAAVRAEQAAARATAGTSREHRLHPMKQPREVPPATFSALGLVCSSKTMAERESRKYSSTYESSLYVGSVLKVLLDHRRSSNWRSRASFALLGHAQLSITTSVLS